MAFSLLLHCSEVSAKGYNFDVLSVEAVIEESRSAGSMNLSRAAIEFYNRGVHKESNEKAIDYEKVEKCLDKYLRCLDYIRCSLHRCFHSWSVMRTYSTVKESIKEYRIYLKEYGDYIVHTGRISTADSYIIKKLRGDYQPSSRGLKRCLWYSYHDRKLFVLVKFLVQLRIYNSF